jgi:hypothetical protein
LKLSNFQDLSVGCGRVLDPNDPNDVLLAPDALPVPVGAPSGSRYGPDRAPDAIHRFPR